jgi:thioester reductase-like protein
MSDRHVFITGYPGFIARRLVKKLLASDESVRISVLVEPAKKSDAEADLSQLANVTADLDVVERVKIYLGDVTAMDVGLSGPEFRTITSEVTELYHLAAAHSLGVEQKLADRVNVQGTANVLSLARAMSKLDRFVHFSSAYVSGDRVGVVMETSSKPARASARRTKLRSIKPRCSSVAPPIGCRSRSSAPRRSSATPAPARAIASTTSTR